MLGYPWGCGVVEQYLPAAGPLLQSKLEGTGHSAYLLDGTLRGTNVGAVADVRVLQDGAHCGLLPPLSSDLLLQLLDGWLLAGLDHEHAVVQTACAEVGLDHARQPFGSRHSLSLDRVSPYEIVPLVLEHQHGDPGTF